MIEPRDFSNLKSFPGEHGNPFDVILHRLEKIQDIPAVIVLIFLLCFAFLIGRFDILLTGIMLVFFLLDWGLLAGLPITKRSFGPEKPTLFLLALLRAPFTLLPTFINIPLQIIGTLLILYAFWIEPFRLTISRQRLYTSKLNSSTSLRLLHLGDLHMERMTRRENAILSTIYKEKPDLITFSGDILNLSYLDDPQAILDARKFLTRLEAPLGVFATSGSPAVDLPGLLPELLKGLSLQWLQNEQTTILLDAQQIQLIGLSCSHRPHQDGPILQEIIVRHPTQPFTILLYHTPDLAPLAAHLGIDLQLSGHTHGGQFRLPWIGALFTGSLYGRVFQNGLYALNQMTLYITRGIGMEGAAAPRMRFLCPPEIIFWDIIPAKNNQGD
jgi:predicted MPP superfamily phosphohydrolase